MGLHNDVSTSSRVSLTSLDIVKESYLTWEVILASSFSVGFMIFKALLSWLGHWLLFKNVAKLLI